MRSRSIDIARGLVIAGVAFNHALDGLIRSGEVAATSWLVPLNDVLYVMRMPALVFLVGLFVPTGVARHGAKLYLARRVSLLLYLLLVWQCVQGAVEISAGRWRNGSTTPADVPRLWLPLAHLWFLPFLAAATAVAVALRTWSRSVPARLVVLTVLLAVSLATWGWDVRYAGSNGTALLLFVVLGSVVGLARLGSLDTWPLTRTLPALLAAVAVFVPLASLGVPATQSSAAPVPVRALSLVAACAGTAALLLLSSALCRVRWVRRPLSHLGRHTLPVYLGHVIVVAGCRAVLTASGAGPVVVLLVAATVSILVCLAVERVARTGPAGLLFSPPAALVPGPRAPSRHRRGRRSA